MSSDESHPTVQYSLDRYTVHAMSVLIRDPNVVSFLNELDQCSARYARSHSKGYVSAVKWSSEQIAMVKVRLDERTHVFRLQNALVPIPPNAIRCGDSIRLSVAITKLWQMGSYIGMVIRATNVFVVASQTSKTRPLCK